MTTRKSNKKPAKKSATKPKKKAKAGGSSFYEGKQLAQSWIPDDDYNEIEQAAQGDMLKMATYLRQVLHKHATELRAARTTSRK